MLHYAFLQNDVALANACVTRMSDRTLPILSSSLTLSLSARQGDLPRGLAVLETRLNEDIPAGSPIHRICNEAVGRVVQCQL